MSDMQFRDYQKEILERLRQLGKKDMNLKRFQNTIKSDRD